MVPLLLDTIAQRRADREEREVRAATAAAEAAAASAVKSARSFAAVASAAQNALGGRFVPRCCWEGDASAAPPHYPIEVIRDIDYGAGGRADTADARAEAPGHFRHRLDIYFSPGALKQHTRTRGEATVPVTIHVHGGGWQRGHKSSEWRGGPNAGRASARHGFVAVVISYRLHFVDRVTQAVWTALFSALLCLLASPFSSFIWNDFALRWMQLVMLSLLGFSIQRWYDRSKVRHPDSALDVALAVAWVRAHIHEHVREADPRRLFLTGHSAGAHLVSLLATDAQYFRAVGLPAPSKVIRGVCAVSGIYLLHAPLYGAADPEPNSLRNIFFRFAYAGGFGRTKEQLDAASPLHLVRKGAPPFLLISATSDLGLEMDAARFATRLRELNVPVAHEVVEATSHSTIASHFERHRAHTHLFDFIERCCAERSPQSDRAGNGSSRPLAEVEPEPQVAAPVVRSPAASSSKKKKGRRIWRVLATGLRVARKPAPSSGNSSPLPEHEPEPQVAAAAARLPAVSSSKKKKAPPNWERKFKYEFEVQPDGSVKKYRASLTARQVARQPPSSSSKKKKTSSRESGASRKQRS